MMDLKEKLECVYETYNKPEYVNPDPLLFLYDYPGKQDREIVGFIAACLAYGRVDQIMKTVSHVLGKLLPTPRRYLMDRTRSKIEADFDGFRYRFAKQCHLVDLLWGMRSVIQQFSSLENCFDQGMHPGDETVLNGLGFLFSQIAKHGRIGHLLADPLKQSACKRSHLFLRWMVRQDTVDPGGWERVNPSQLIVPLDTHMYKTGILFGFTQRKAADLKTALEITNGYRKIVPEDPVKYDFCLTRFGIRKGLSLNHLKDIVCGDTHV